jgi:hypothetical protein
MTSPIMHARCLRRHDYFPCMCRVSFSVRAYEPPEWPHFNFGLKMTHTDYIKEGKAKHGDSERSIIRVKMRPNPTDTLAFLLVAW